MNNNIFNRKRVAVVAVGCVLSLAFLTGGAFLTHTQGANTSVPVEVQSAPDMMTEHLATASVPIAIGGEATVLSGTFTNGNDVPLAAGVFADHLDTSAFTDGELNATLVLVTVEAGLESVTVSTSLREFASPDTMRNEQIGVSTMEVDPGEAVSYSVTITPPAVGDPKLDHEPFTADIHLSIISESRASEEAGS